MGHHPGDGDVAAADVADLHQESALDDEDAAAAAADGADARAFQGRPGAAAARDGGSLQAQPREPGGWMSADAAATADLYRPLRSPPEFGGAAPRAVHLVDQGPFGPRLPAGVVDAADTVHALPWDSGAGARNGRQYLPSAMDDADFAGPQSAADDDADAPDFHRDVRQFSGRPFAILLCVKRAGCCPAGVS